MDEEFKKALDDAWKGKSVVVKLMNDLGVPVVAESDVDLPAVEEEHILAAYQRYVKNG